jgi:hypothetical protein
VIWVKGDGYRKCLDGRFVFTGAEHLHPFGKPGSSLQVGAATLVHAAYCLHKRLYGVTTKSPNMVKLWPGKVHTNW